MSGSTVRRVSQSVQSTVRGGACVIVNFATWRARSPALSGLSRALRYPGPNDRTRRDNKEHHLPPNKPPQIIINEHLSCCTLLSARAIHPCQLRPSTPLPYYHCVPPLPLHPPSLLAELLRMLLARVLRLAAPNRRRDPRPPIRRLRAHLRDRRLQLRILRRRPARAAAPGRRRRRRRRLARSRRLPSRRPTLCSRLLRRLRRTLCLLCCSGRRRGRGRTLLPCGGSLWRRRLLL